MRRLLLLALVLAGCLWGGPGGDSYACAAAPLATGGSFPCGGGVSAMVPTHIQDCLGADAQNASAITCTGSAIGSGHAVVGAVTYGAASADVLSVTTNAGDTCTVGVSVVDSTNAQVLTDFYCTNITSGATTVTANLSTTQQPSRILWSEFSNIAKTSPSDGAAGALTVTTSAANSGAITTGGSGDLIYAINTKTHIAVVSYTAGAGFTLLKSDAGSGTTNQMAAEDQIQSAAGSISGTFTLGANSSSITIVRALRHS